MGSLGIRYSLLPTPHSRLPEENASMSADLAQVARTALIGELEQLRDAIREQVQPLGEAQLWKKPVEPGNSIGHLILHLTGNLNHFVGAQLGGTGYVRDREREFTEANPPSKATLLANLDAAVGLFHRVVGGLSAEQLAGPHPGKAVWDRLANAGASGGAFRVCTGGKYRIWRGW